MRRVIYTAIMGNYDQLRTPKVENPGWDHVCFTDNPELRSDIWDIRLIDSTEYGHTRTARWVKICPHLFFDHDLTIWVDGSFKIRCYLDEFVEQYHNGVFTLMSHGRDCLYDEADCCGRIGKDKKEVIDLQMKGYREQGYPEKNGMVATGMMIRNKREDVAELCRLWWREVRLGSKRDQLSFGYSLWKKPLDINVIDFSNVINNYMIWMRHNGV